MTGPSIQASKREADVAREKLLASVHALQTRLKPAALADQALEKIRRRSEEAGEGALAAARRRPIAAAAAAGGLVALIAAGPIARLVRRVRARK